VHVHARENDESTQSPRDAGHPNATREPGTVATAVGVVARPTTVDGQQCGPFSFSHAGRPALGPDEARWQARVRGPCGFSGFGSAGKQQFGTISCILRCWAVWLIRCMWDAVGTCGGWSAMLRADHIAIWWHILHPRVSLSGQACTLCLSGTEITTFPA
jgi:hypothetical protein